MKFSLLITMCLLSVSQVPLSAAEMVPVKGRHVYPSFTLGDVFIDPTCNGPAIPLKGPSYGNVTHLGKFSESADVTFCLLWDPPGLLPPLFDGARVADDFIDGGAAHGPRQPTGIRHLSPSRCNLKTLERAAVNQF